ncbi:MAG: S-adenosylmethionine:tRNA ribosyltransferase-isomerase [Acidimicrobiales bacterium]
MSARTALGGDIFPGEDTVEAPLSFDLPAVLEASAPPEARGLTRDAVKMLVARRSPLEVIHSHFSELPRFLDEGDLVLINTSGTLAAEVSCLGPEQTPMELHLSTQLPAGLWTLELRRGAKPYFDAEAGQVLTLPEGATSSLLAPHATRPEGVRLWVATLELPEPLPAYLVHHGRPIRYSHVTQPWPLSYYQNVYATEPGSAEMPSAGRPFTPEVLTRLVAKGVGVAPIVLHTGVASLEVSEAPYPEYFHVPDATAARVNDTHRRGGRVIAVGTTVVRAIETVADYRGRTHGASGWTETVIGADRGVRVVDGLLTGWHEPEASHLAILEAVAGRRLLVDSYGAALDGEYLWHEFGDVHLVLP